MRVAAIDQGTTSTRALIVGDGTAEVVASFQHATSYPNDGWVEQDAGELLRNVQACLDAVGDVDALGLANQGESCLAWDGETGEPLTPVIVWQDSRTAAGLARMDAAMAARVAALSGLPVDAYFSASKLGWIMQHSAEARTAHDRGRLRLGTTDAFFLDRLAGRFVTDRATASRTSLLNLATGEWDAELCGIFGVPIECLPRVVANVGDFGVAGKAPVRASIVDQQAALYGHGCRARGEAKITFGTGAFALALSGDSAIDATAAGGLLPTIAWDLGGGIQYALDGGVYDVGSAIDWAIRAGLASGVADFAGFEAPSAISRGIVFVPAFSGLAAPHWDRTAAPLIAGLGANTTRRDMCQALLEGIAFATTAVVETMAAALPLTSPISIDGGVSRSPYFAQFLAETLSREVVVRGFGERTALGAAMLAATTLGRSLEVPAGDDRSYRPRGEVSAAHRQRYEAAVQHARQWRDASGT